jgi:hypothetical protein
VFWIEDIAELDHLHEADADDGRLGIVAHVETVAETGAHSHDVLAKHKAINSFELFVLYLIEL